MKKVELDSKGAWSLRSKDRFCIVELDGHEYIYDTHSDKITVHNENCVCKIKKESA